MKTFKTSALVLSTRPLGEADRLVTLLTREAGKVAAVARGARKTKSKLASGVDLFTRAYMSLYSGKSLYTVTQVEIKERFDYLHRDPLLYAYACYFAELVEMLMVEGEPREEMYGLLLGGWRSLSRGGDSELLARSYELKFLLENGTAPLMEECTGCLAPTRSPRWFSVGLGGVVCSDCAVDGKNYLPILPGTVTLARHLMNTPFTGLTRVRATPEQKEQLKKILPSFIEYHLEIRECRSLRYIERWEKNS